MNRDDDHARANRTDGEDLNLAQNTRTLLLPSTAPFDLSAIRDILLAFQQSDEMKKLAKFQADIVRSLAKSIGPLELPMQQLSAVGEALREITRVFPKISEPIFSRITSFDFQKIIGELGTGLPANISELVLLESTADIALEEGLSMSWIPRNEIMEVLIEAANPEARLAILSERRDEILDDCEGVLARSRHELAIQCRKAIDILRQSHHELAQSHTSNIIDSIILKTFKKDGREEAKDKAQEVILDLPLTEVAETLTLRPLLKAFTPWFPNSGIDPPSHFSRHATSHGVGHPDVFSPDRALIAVMLATSLTVQYTPDVLESQSTTSNIYD